MRISQRGQVDPFIVMDVMERARAREAQGHRVIHMEVGQPGTPAPEGARAALAAAMGAGPLGYTVGLGLPALRARIARHYADSYGVDLDPARVVVTAGASGAFILAFTALFEAGETVGLGLPGYPSYRHILSALSLDPRGIETRMEDRFQPVPDQITDDLAGLIVASPGNPAGTMLMDCTVGQRSASSRMERSIHAPSLNCATMTSWVWTSMSCSARRRSWGRMSGARGLRRNFLRISQSVTWTDT